MANALSPRAHITPGQDAEYMDAVNAGDMDKARRMVAEAAKLAMPDTKIVDADGNPMVVYHQTNGTRYINRETGQDWDLLDWEERQEWEDRDDWEDFWEERDFYTFDRRSARQSVEMPAYFFSPEYDEYHEYGDRTVAAFINVTNPAVNPDIPDAGKYDDSGRRAMDGLIAEGYDGFIRRDEDRVWEYGVFESSQIKSADLADSVLKNGFDDVTLRELDQYIDDAYRDQRLPLFQRVPQEMGRSLRGRAGKDVAIDSLLGRIAEGAVSPAGRAGEDARRAAQERKSELLEAWAKATGNRREGIGDFTGMGLDFAACGA